MNNLPIFPYVIETHLVDHCNLNCKGCSHFAPLVPGEVFLDIDNFKRDLVALRRIFRDVYEVRLMGGEPLLHPDIIHFIEITRRIFPKTKISIFTNGLLLTKMKGDFWEACNINHALVKITKYPLPLDIKTIKQLGQTYHIRIKIPKQINTFYQFININGDANPRKSFRTCRAVHMCPFLRDGKLYTCAFAPHLGIFNRYFNQEIPLSPKDYINILEDVSAEKVFEYLKNPIPLCRWCKTYRTPMKWDKSKHELQEWVTDETKALDHTWFLIKKRAISAYHHVKHFTEIKLRHKNED